MSIKTAQHCGHLLGMEPFIKDLPQTPLFSFFYFTQIELPLIIKGTSKVNQTWDLEAIFIIRLISAAYTLPTDLTAGNEQTCRLDWLI